MRCSRALVVGSYLLAVACAPSDRATSGTDPLTIGETFLLESSVLGETRRINVYVPPGSDGRALPVLYMPDGGLAEDFLHVAGLVQVSVGNGTMRPHVLVGIENTERRRDLTGPTDNAEDRKIAPRVGGAEAFRTFIRSELMPEIGRRYAVTAETAIVGESLAGLFVVETLLLDPDLFDTYIAIDPSLWWNDSRLLTDQAALLQARAWTGKSLVLASSAEPGLAEAARRFASTVADANVGIRFTYMPFPDESHATIYHLAALHAFRWVLAPEARE